VITRAGAPLPEDWGSFLGRFRSVAYRGDGFDSGLDDMPFTRGRPCAVEVSADVAQAEQLGELWWSHRWIAGVLALELAGVVIDELQFLAGGRRVFSAARARELKRQKVLRGSRGWLLDRRPFDELFRLWRTT